MTPPDRVTWRETEQSARSQITSEHSPVCDEEEEEGVQSWGDLLSLHSLMKQIYNNRAINMQINVNI